MFNLWKEVSIYSRRSVRGYGLMGLRPEMDNTTDVLFVSLVQVEIVGQMSPSPDWCHVGVLTYFSSDDRGARLTRACWTLIGPFHCHLYLVYHWR
ncbi:hypothetical protein HanIR_Chr01g0008941 [Helianthus annuus]|nr:hypothetical protein HanIR_Chr01g0008941 [Helianthus annuus]